MNHCIRLFLLFVPSFIALGLLSFALATNWWTVALKKNIPTSNSFNVSSSSDSDTRSYSTLVRVPISRGLFSECVTYQNAVVRVSTAYDFRPEISQTDRDRLANETCNADQFTCQTGVAIARPLTRCIDRQQECNRIVDCEDKSDETSCHGNMGTRDEEFFQCSNGYIKCLDQKSCYRREEQTCDGVSNCLDDSDERNCNEIKCRRTQHVYCSQERKCARRENSNRCDGIADCADNSDEENCDRCLGGANMMLCDSKCFPEKYRCDGIVQCSDSRDEMDCDSFPSVTPRQSTWRDDRQCMERRFNPIRFVPPSIESSILEAYPHPQNHAHYLAILHYLQLIVFYGIVGSIFFIFLSIITLFFFACCCRHRCMGVPFGLYGIWMFLAWILVTMALITFFFVWIWQKQTVLDNDKALPLDVMIHELNPTLRQIEFFGLSFWLACGAALATFVALIISCCVCCTLGSSRAEDKEYEIMQMQAY